MRRLLEELFSKMFAAIAAEKHLEETYAGTDFYIERIAYSFKDGKYHAFVKSPTRIQRNNDAMARRYPSLIPAGLITIRLQSPKQC